MSATSFIRHNILSIVIIGVIGLCLAGIITLSVLKADPKPKDQIPQLLRSTADLMAKSTREMEQAQKLLSKDNPSASDQQKGEQLIEASIADAKKATDAQPDHPATWLLLSQQYEYLFSVNPQTIHLAEDAINKALELQPDNPVLNREQAQVAIAQKNYPLAKQALTKALKSDPQNANYHFKLGNVLKELNDIKAARKEYTEARQLTDSKVNRAMIDIQLRSLDKMATAAATGKKSGFSPK